VCLSLWRVGGNEQVAVGSRLLGSLLSWYSHLGVLHRKRVAGNRETSV
jgi:hypothetical protein